MAKHNIRRRLIIEDMLINGHSPREIKREFPEICSSLITVAKKRLGIKTLRIGRPAGARNKGYEDREMEIRKAKQAGETYQEIADRFGCTRQAIHMLIKPDVSRSGRCFNCGKPGKNLHFHHQDYIHGTGVLMCISCHRSEHRKTSK